MSGWKQTSFNDRSSSRLVLSCLLLQTVVLLQLELVLELEGIDCQDLGDRGSSSGHGGGGQVRESGTEWSVGDKEMREMIVSTRDPLTTANGSRGRSGRSQRQPGSESASTHDPLANHRLHHEPSPSSHLLLPPPLPVRPFATWL